MVKLLSDKGFHKWINVGNQAFIRGWTEQREGSSFSITRDLKDVATSETLSDLLTDTYGNFSVIIDRDDKLLAAVDNIASFPLFYTQRDGDFIISDNLVLLKEKYKLELDAEQKQIYYASGFNLGKNTVYKDVFQLEAGQILSYNKETKMVSITDYYLHKHCVANNQETETLCSELDTCVMNVMKRMLRSIENKPIVLFLSGGYDSKLILSTLRRLQYEKVICVSLGGMDTKDVSVAKEIAASLGYKWIRVNVNQAYWREFRKTSFFNKYFSTFAGFGTRPYLQGITIKGLIESGEVPKDCVVISGNSGDAIEGADVTHKFISGERYSAEDILDTIRYKHFLLNGYKESIITTNKVDFEHYSKYITDKNGDFTDEECEDIFEFFNWRERQSKYVINDLHNYEEVLGLDWRLPLWDKEFEDFWLKVSYEQRYDRKLYYEYVKAEKLPSANEVSISRKVFNEIKAALGKTINVFYIPKSLWNYRFSTKYYYATYGLLTYKELFSILKTSSGNREPHMEGITRIMYSYY